MIKLSEKTKSLTQSGIRAASARCAEINGINLGQGVCDIPAQDVLKQAASEAIQHDNNLYATYEGVIELREAIAEKCQSFNHIKVDPINEVMVSHGSTGSFVAAALTLFNPGDEVILFEPFYGYHKSLLEFNGIQVKAVPINLQDFSIDFAELQKALGKNTRGIVICSPCNPSGKVFTKQELLAIGEIAEKNDLYVITDEIYEYITYPGHEHISFASLNNFKERTVTISGLSKTYNITGWRLGYASGPKEIISKMALVHDLLYICPVTPLQYAALAAFKMPAIYYKNMVEHFLIKRDSVANSLKELGFKVTVPQGAYYILADFSELGFADDTEAASMILEKAKVATVTGRSFFMTPQAGKNIVRLCYALGEDKLSLAMENMKKVLRS